MKKGERRAQILAEAQKVFARLGYHAAKIDDIVEGAGVARGTFYLYFEDKRAIFAELVERFLARLHLAIHRIDLGNPALPVPSQVRDNIERILSIFLLDAAMTKILLTDAPGLDVEFDRKLQAVYAVLHELLSESLREGQEHGLVAVGDTRVFAFLAVGSMKELLAQAVRREWGIAEAKRLTEQMFAFMCAGCLRMGVAPPNKGSAQKAPRSLNPASPRAKKTPPRV